MKCRNYNILCKNKARKDKNCQWYYCNPCLSNLAYQDMKKHPKLFKMVYNADDYNTNIQLNK